MSATLGFYWCFHVVSTTFLQSREGKMLSLESSFPSVVICRMSDGKSAHFFNSLLQCSTDPFTAYTLNGFLWTKMTIRHFNCALVLSITLPGQLTLIARGRHMCFLVLSEFYALSEHFPLNADLAEPIEISRFSVPRPLPKQFFFEICLLRKGKKTNLCSRRSSVGPY